MYILCTRVMYSLHYNCLLITFTSLIILYKTYFNLHRNTFISTLSLIFTCQSHIILLSYDSQEILFYRKAKLTFPDESTRIKDQCQFANSICYLFWLIGRVLSSFARIYMLLTTLPRSCIAIIQYFEYYCSYYSVMNYVTTILYCHHRLTSHRRISEINPLDTIATLFNWSFSSFLFPFHQQENHCVVTCVHGSGRGSLSK